MKMNNITLTLIRVLIGLVVFVDCESKHGEGYKCEESEGLTNPYWDNSCRAGSAWDVDTHCCRLCADVCSPGWRQPPRCVGPCQQCPRGSYSELAHNTECLTCTNCKRLHRVYIHECQPARNSLCGECFKGFFSHPDHAEDTTVSCIACVPGYTDIWCPDVQTSLPTTKHPTTPSVPPFNQPNKPPPEDAVVASSELTNCSFTTQITLILVVCLLLIVIISLNFHFYNQRKKLKLYANFNNSENIPLQPGTVNQDPDTVNQVPDTVNQDPDTVNQDPDTVNQVPGSATNENLSHD